MLNSETWYCTNCQCNRFLDQHGRCEKCQSDALVFVGLSEHNPMHPPADREIQRQLEGVLD